MLVPLCHCCQPLPACTIRRTSTSTSGSGPAAARARSQQQQTDRLRCISGLRIAPTQLPPPSTPRSTTQQLLLPAPAAHVVCLKPAFKSDPSPPSDIPIELLGPVVLSVSRPLPTTTLDTCRLHQPGGASSRPGPTVDSNRRPRSWTQGR